MKSIQQHILRHQARFTKHPFFARLEANPPLERLAPFPLCLTFFVVTFEASALVDRCYREMTAMFDAFEAQIAASSAPAPSRPQPARSAGGHAAKAPPPRPFARTTSPRVASPRPR